MTGYDKKTIDVVIEKYKSKNIQNDYREICDKIIQHYEDTGIIEDFEVRLIWNQWDAKGNEIAASVRNKISNPAAEVRIQLSKMPKNCIECPLLIRHTEEDSFDFGRTMSCPFGCDCYETVQERPCGCPIKLV